VELNDSKSRKRLNNWYSKNGQKIEDTTNQGRYSSHGTRKIVGGDSESHKPPLSTTSNYKRGSLSNTPLMKLDDQEQKNLEQFNNTVKTDNMSTNIWSLFSHIPQDYKKKKQKIYYNSSGVHQSIFNKKEKFNNFKKRKKKYKKSTINKGKSKIK